MRGFIVPIGFAIVTAFAWPAAAQTSTATVGIGPGKGKIAKTVKVVATITAIDMATRDVTLKGPQGYEMTVTAGADVKNFANMRVGDQVAAEYVEAVTLELKKGGGQKVARTVQEEGKGAKSGELPAGIVGRQVTTVADVIAVDQVNKTVTLRGPQRTVTLAVSDPEQFKLIAKGDQVEARFTQALAIAIEPQAKK